jgi:hypothetical protein
VFLVWYACGVTTLSLIGMLQMSDTGRFVRLIGQFLAWRQNTLSPAKSEPISVDATLLSRYQAQYGNGRLWLVHLPCATPPCPYCYPRYTGGKLISSNPRCPRYYGIVCLCPQAAFPRPRAMFHASFLAYSFLVLPSPSLLVALEAPTFFQVVTPPLPNILL